jgi:hypothetical protein
MEEKEEETLVSVANQRKQASSRLSGWQFFQCSFPLELIISLFHALFLFFK